MTSYKTPGEQCGANPTTLAQQALLDFGANLEELKGIEHATSDQKTKNQLGDLIRRMENNLKQLA